MVDRHLMRLLLTCAAGAMAYLLVPGLPDFPETISGGVWMRAVAAGAVVGLTLFGAEEIKLSPLVALAASMVGLLLLAVLSPAPGFLLQALLTLPLAAGVAFGSAWARSRLSVSAALWLSVAFALLFAMWGVGLLGGTLADGRANVGQMLALPIEPEGYDFDGLVFIRTWILGSEGMGHYEALGTAFADKATVDEPPSGMFGYRAPTIFWLWRLLPGPRTATTLFSWSIAFSVAFMLLSWFFARRYVDDGIALLAPLAVSSLMHLVIALQVWFPFPEIWSGTTVVAALMLTLRKRWLASAAMLFLAIAIRELAVVFLPAWLVAWALVSDRRRDWPAVVVVIGLPAVALAAHFAAVPSEGGLGAVSLTPWLQSEGVPTLLMILQFGALTYAAGTWVPVALAAAAIAGAALLTERWQRWTLLSALVVPLAFLTLVSAGPFGDYWAMMLLPLVLTVWPLVFAPVLPAIEGPSLGGAATAGKTTSGGRKTTRQTGTAGAKRGKARRANRKRVR